MASGTEAQPAFRDRRDHAEVASRKGQRHLQTFFQVRGVQWVFGRTRANKRERRNLGRVWGKREIGFCSVLFFRDALSFIVLKEKVDLVK